MKFNSIKNQIQIKWRLKSVYLGIDEPVFEFAERNSSHLGKTTSALQQLQKISIVDHIERAGLEQRVCLAENTLIGLLALAAQLGANQIDQLHLDFVANRRVPRHQLTLPARVLNERQ